MPHLLRNHKSDFNKSEILDADFTVNIFFDRATIMKSVTPKSKLPTKHPNQNSLQNISEKSFTFKRRFYKWSRFYRKWRIDEETGILTGTSYNYQLHVGPK